MPRHPDTLRARGALVALALALTFSACGGDDGTEADTTEAPAGSTSTTATTAAGGSDPYGNGGGNVSGASGTIVAADFSLSDLTVEPGADVVFDNQDSVAHTATADDGAFDLGEVAGGETSDPVAAPDEPGDYGFHCEIHPDMTATLTVGG